MSKLVLVAKREYLERVRSKWFLIGTLLGPILMSAFILVPIMIAKFSSPNQSIAIVNAANDPELSKAVETKLSAKKRSTYKITQKTAADAAALATLQSELTKQVENGDFNGYIVLKPESVKDGKVDYYAKNVSDFIGFSQIEDATNDAIVERRFINAGLDATKISELSKPIEMKRNKLTSGGDSKEDKGQSFILAYVMMLIIYMTTVLYGVAVLRGVIEEKQSRIVEVIISSMSPMELMFGKLIGIGLVGLTQFTFWAICSALLPTAFGAMAVASGATMPDIPISLLVYFVVFFILGYFLYATLYAMAGSIVSSEQDSNSVQMPITMLLVISVMFASLILQDPNSKVSVIASMIPFFAPILMFLRITVQTPPFWQIATSIGIMLVTIVACSWIASKIYRVGILMYGKRPNLPELIKWLRYT